MGCSLVPLLGFKEKKDAQYNLWLSLLLKIIFYNKLSCQNAQNGISDLLYFQVFLGGGGACPQTPPRGSCLRYSLLPPPTQPSTPKLIENPGVDSSRVPDDSTRFARSRSSRYAYRKSSRQTQ